jgi:hypothetical protein
MKLTRTYQITDLNSLSSVCSQIILVNDTIKPAIGEISQIDILSGVNCQFTIPDLSDTVRAVSIDNCTNSSSLTISQNPIAGTMISSDSQVAVTVTDACGNDLLLLSMLLFQFLLLYQHLLPLQLFVILKIVP